MNETISMISGKMMRDLTENILPFWMHKATDPVGGWHGEILRDGTVVPGAKRSLILNARILWTFSAAYRVLKRPEYLEAARRAFDYITTRFLDPSGGAYNKLNADGSVAEHTKFTYAQGFTLYAFSEYARATGGEGIELADRMFGYIERECKTDAGYLEFAKGSPELESDPGKMLTMNTHLHIIEPVTNYLRIRRTPQIEAASRNLLRIFFDRIISGDCPHFDLFFTPDWQPLVHENSYGHDIEGSWLLFEAAEVLGDAELLAQAKTTALAMAGAVLTEGIAASGAVYDHGIRGADTPEPLFVWWGQAEGIVGFINAYQLSGDKKYLDAAIRCWDYTAEKIINPGGEWFATGTDSIDDENTPYLVDAWKCPYHNGRAALEVLDRI